MVSYVTALAHMLVLSAMPLYVWCQPPGAAANQQQQLLGFQLQAADAFLKTFSDHFLFSGTVAYSKSGNLSFNAAYVANSTAVENPIKASDVFPLGTGALSYIAAAAYQLRDAGALDVDQPVTAYLDPADFGFASQWCPKPHVIPRIPISVQGEPTFVGPAPSPAEEQAACSVPSIRQILGMNAGIVDVAGCVYMPSAWQTEYCINTHFDNSSMVSDALQGSISIAELIGTFLWQTPLDFPPGEGFKFSPSGYWLVAYIIEKLTGSDLADYMATNIFLAANLGSTSSGTPFSPGISSTNDTVAVPGFSSAFTANTSVPPAYLPQGTYANSTQLVPMDNEILLVAGLGSIWASASDLIAWYQTLLSSPALLNLQATTVNEMLTPAPFALVNLNFYYAQGFGVVPRADSPLLIDSLAVTGRYSGIKTSLYMQVNASSMPVLDALAVFTNTEPNFLGFGSPNVTQECAVALSSGQSNMQVPCRMGYDGGKVTNAIQQTLLAGLEMTDDPTAIIYSEF